MSNFAAVNEVEEDFLGTPIALMEENVKRRLVLRLNLSNAMV